MCSKFTATAELCRVYLCFQLRVGRFPLRDNTVIEVTVPSLAMCQRPWEIRITSVGTKPLFISSIYVAQNSIHFALSSITFKSNSSKCKFTYLPVEYTLIWSRTKDHRLKILQSYTMRHVSAFRESHHQAF